jgi:hypothetical protein
LRRYWPETEREYERFQGGANLVVIFGLFASTGLVRVEVSTYYEEKKDDSLFTLVGPRRPVKLNSTLFDDFFRNKAFKVDMDDKRSFHHAKLLADHFLKETYKFMPFTQIAIDGFKTDMKKCRSMHTCYPIVHMKILNA